MLPAVLCGLCAMSPGTTASTPERHRIPGADRAATAQGTRWPAREAPEGAGERGAPGGPDVGGGSEARAGHGGPGAARQRGRNGGRVALRVRGAEGAAGAPGVARTTGVRVSGALTAQAPSATGNPMAPNLGFGVVTRRDALLAGTGAATPVAVGGDLTLGSRFGIAPHRAGGYTAPGDARPTGLLVHGTVDLPDSAADAVLRVAGDHYVKVGDLTGAAARTTGMDGAPVKTRLVAAGAGYGTTPRVELTTAQPPASVGPARGPLDFGALFTGHRRHADALARCPATVTPHRATHAPGSTVRIRLADDRTNVLRLTGAQLAAVRELVVENRPTATRPLVVAVDTTAEGGALSWRTPRTTGLDDGDARYVLWTFADTTHLTLAAGDTLRGSVYAPRAELTDRSPADIEGDVVVRSLRSTPRAGGVRSAPFAAEPECDRTAAPAPLPSPGRAAAPEAVRMAGAEPEPGPEAKPGTEPGPAGEPGRKAEAGVGPDTGREPDPEAKPGPGAAGEGEAEPGTGPAAPAEAATDTRPGSGPSPAEVSPAQDSAPGTASGGGAPDTPPGTAAVSAMADTGSRTRLWLLGAAAALLVAIGTALTRASRRARRDPGQ
ncbi:hypothetical protein GCM10010274_28840 [Streptomyces lavendofoliae]|uniref:Choice-of-anchor A domain-containing protein n=1 Tax=Streptomyces lavendofoliae TaxID=67314 RepID=A0A918HYL3_9ACTN|nr:hypothetical protein GCM10010274_28840 [Streptomyces lavendofoliae]